MRLVRFVPALVLAVTLTGSFGNAHAGWPNDPGVNLHFAPSAGNQFIFLTAEDGAGGAFIIWNESIYVRAQHVTATGLIAAGWPSGGLTIGGGLGSAFPSAIASDGAGGVFVTWDDYRSGNSDVYGQHVSGNGTLSWAATGAPICTAADAQYSSRICVDRAGGMIVTWQDQRTLGGTSYDVYAQRISSAGSPLWTANGVAVCALANAQDFPVIVSDGTVGGSYLAWKDNRAGNTDIYAQRLDGSGVPAPGWPANGLAVAAVPGGVDYPVIAGDGSFGLYVAWGDARANYDLYLSRLTAAGAVASGWPASGLPVTSNASAEFNPVIAPDGSGGVLLAWTDYRGDVDIYAQRVNGSGLSQWAAGGRAVCTASGVQFSPQIVSDGAGGMVLGWNDQRAGGPSMVYASRVTAAGSIASGFAADGNPVATAHWVQLLTACSDGAGGAIFAWQHNGSPQQGYAQRIDRWGYLGAQASIASVQDVPNDQGGRVKLSWDRSPLDAYPSTAVTAYMLYRSVPAAAALAALARGEAVLSAGVESAVRPAGAAPRAFVTTEAAGDVYYWEYLAEVAAAQLPGYSYLAPTAQDSTGAGNPSTVFMVRAYDWVNTRWWDSDPDSGYSVDDLAPAAPAPFAGIYTDGATRLFWDPNTEPDLAGYRLYRGNDAGFVPGPGNLIASPPDTGYADVGPSGSYYKITAVDVHGNESPATLLAPGGTLAAGDVARWSLALAPAAPNPSSGPATCRFTLPSAGRVKVAVYDAAGRQLRVLADATMTAGAHALQWDGAGADGARVPSGVYMVRLSFGERTLNQKLLRVR